MDFSATFPEVAEGATTALFETRPLGRSGLRVSPLTLGTMTWGESWGFGANAEVARQQFDLYTSLGGNIIDTANKYTEGESETLVRGPARGVFARAG